MASLLANQPLPRGRRVGIVTNVGGPGILCADACEAARAGGPAARPRRRGRACARSCRAEASVANPVDMIASATADAVPARRSSAGGRRSDVDAVIVIFIPPLVDPRRGRGPRDRRRRARAGRGKPLLTVFMSSRGVPDGCERRTCACPSYAFPEAAAIALARGRATASGGRGPPRPLPRPEGCAATRRRRSSPRRSGAAAAG